uniref:Uncharacterized protein n=1 Tax=Setaria digitata TaxID=48799 RepID=A0A915PV86_9BILA
MGELTKSGAVSSSESSMDEKRIYHRGHMATYNQVAERLRTRGGDEWSKERKGSKEALSYYSLESIHSVAQQQRSMAQALAIPAVTTQTIPSIGQFR